MTQNSIKAFILVAEIGSIAEAARESFISPQSLWKSISSLEAELKTKLFDRKGKYISLSATGKLWYNFFQRQQTESERLVAQLQVEAMSSKQANKLRLAIATGVWTNPEITRALQQYTRLLPEHPLVLRLVSPYQSMDMLDFGEVDAALTIAESPSSVFLDTVLKSDQYYIITNGRDAAPDPDLSYQDFLSEDFLLALDSENSTPLEARLLFSGLFRRLFGVTPHVRVLRNSASVNTELQLGNGVLLANGFDSNVASPFLRHYPAGGESFLLFRRTRGRDDDSIRLLAELLKKEHRLKGDDNA